MNRVELTLFLLCILNCGHLANAELNIVEVHFYIAIFTIIGWGLLIVFLAGMLSGLCYWQHRRVRAMDTISRLHRTGLQHTLMQHEGKMIQPINYHEHSIQSFPSSNSPQSIVTPVPGPKINTLQRHQAYITNGPRNYYPPSEVALSNQGPRWSTAKQMPEF